MCGRLGGCQLSNIIQWATASPLSAGCWCGRCRRRPTSAVLANLPSHDFAINTAWLTLVLIATDLLAWAKALCLDGELATAEPKRTLLHTAGVLVRSARRTTLRL